MFTKPQGNTIQSDSGFTVRQRGMAGMVYMEGEKVMDVDSEVQGLPETTIAVWRSTVRAWRPPHDKEVITEAKREEILNNIRAALEWNNTRVIIA